jgi:hypothetical protein
MAANDSIEERLKAIRASIAEKRERAQIRGDIRSKVAASSDVSSTDQDSHLRELLNLVRREHLKPSHAALADFEEPAVANHGLPHRLKSDMPQLS